MKKADFFQKITTFNRQDLILVGEYKEFSKNRLASILHDNLQMSKTSFKLKRFLATFTLYAVMSLLIALVPIMYFGLDFGSREFQMSLTMCLVFSAFVSIALSGIPFESFSTKRYVWRSRKDIIPRVLKLLEKQRIKYNQKLHEVENNIQDFVHQYSFPYFDKQNRKEYNAHAFYVKQYENRCVELQREKDSARAIIEHIQEEIDFLSSVIQDFK